MDCKLKTGNDALACVLFDIKGRERLEIFIVNNISTVEQAKAKIKESIPKLQISGRISKIALLKLIEVQDSFGGGDIVPIIISGG